MQSIEPIFQIGFMLNKLNIHDLIINRIIGNLDNKIIPQSTIIDNYTDSIKYYIRSVLNKSDTMVDVHTLLFNNYHKFLPAYSTHPNEVSTLSSEEILEFKLKYKDYETILEQYILTDLLCR